MKIEIPTPCPEDQKNMTPVEGGSYCGRCEKKVFDFTEKSTTYIKSFFAEKEAGKKICARFSTSQLLEINFDSFFSRFRFWNFTRKFAVIFYFVFGLTLFSCGPTVQGEMVEPKITGDSIASFSNRDTLSIQNDSAALVLENTQEKTEKENVKNLTEKIEKVTTEQIITQEPKNHPPPLPIAPYYKDGPTQMEKVIASNLKYPEEAKSNKIEGTVKVVFKITTDGKMKDIQTEKKLGYGCEEEAVRLVKLLKEWNPGKRGSEKMEMNFAVNVVFKL